MKIYIAHPTNMDYGNEIYKPLRSDSFFSQHELIVAVAKEMIEYSDSNDLANKIRNVVEKQSTCE